MRMPIAMRGSNNRAAFTLIELLIVITIIAILVALFAGGIYRLISTGTQVTLRTEIGGMELGLQTAMTQWHADSLPSMIRLRTNINNYNPAINPHTDNIDAVSLNALKQMFGRNVGSGNISFNWNPLLAQPQDILLEGEEAIVFYLGGIPSVQNGVISMTGFSTNKQDPTSTSGNSRINPFFDFKSSRLTQSTNFVRYLDPYTNSGPNPQPYAFFSCAGPNNTTNTNGIGYGNDCPSLISPASGQSLQPYINGSQFINQNSFQIISAGADQQFGPGGSYNPTKGNPSGPGFDDTANFSSSILGNPQS